MHFLLTEKNPTFLHLQKQVGEVAGLSKTYQLGRCAGGGHCVDRSPASRSGEGGGGGGEPTGEEGGDQREALADVSLSGARG